MGGLAKVLLICGMIPHFNYNRNCGLLAGLLLYLLSQRDIAQAVHAQSRGKGSDYVILLHGMGRTALSMKPIEWRLKKDGYRVINESYESTRRSIPALADGYLDHLIRQHVNDPEVRVHFVTHSLGGIVLRQYLSNHVVPNLSRVVMVAPPNQGSQLAEKLKAWWIYRRLTGFSGQQLGTARESIPCHLGRADFDVGIIAGDHSFNPLFSHWIPGSDDGKVAVEDTRLDGMRDFLILHHSHTWLPWRKDSITAIRNFLTAGCFAF